MICWRLLCTGLILLLLSACAAQQTGTTPSDGTTRKAKPSAIKGTDLPCAEVSTAEGLLISYPAESLYLKGAALPTSDGLACLEVLAGWLKTVAGTPLVLTVSGEEGLEYDGQSLAAKREELLKRYLERQGVDLRGLQWTLEKGAGFQLQITEE